MTPTDLPGRVVVKKLAAQALSHLPKTRAPSVEAFADSPGAVTELVDLGPAEPRVGRLSVDPPSYQQAFSLEPPAKFVGWQPLVATVPHARLVEPGIGVVDADGRLIKESLWDVEHYRRNFRRRLPRGPGAYDGSATSLLTLWGDNYYHWLIDALPRLGVLEASGRDFRELQVVVPARLTRFQRESLDALGIPAAHRVASSGSSLRLAELTWASPAAPIGFCRPFIPAWLRTQFVRSPVERSKRLLVSRRVRSIANEHEVLEVLEPYGFELVRPEELSFLDQVQLFASAEMVVGPHGAGMANLAFGQDLRVLEVFQPGYLNTGPYSVCWAAGHDYWALIGDAVPRPGAAKDTDIHVDPDRLRAAITEMAASL